MLHEFYVKNFIMKGCAKNGQVNQKPRKVWIKSRYIPK